MAVKSIPPETRYAVIDNDGDLAGALNAGIEAAETEYLLRLDCDDILQPNHVQLQLDACWDVDVVYPNVALLNEDSQQTGMGEPGEFCPNRLLIEKYLPGSGCVVRRSKVLEAGGYRNVPAWSDWDLWVRMLRAGGKFKAHRETMYAHRIHEGMRSQIPQELAGPLRTRIVGELPELVASFYTQETAATTYWRCTLPARYLPAQSVMHQPMAVPDPDRVVVFPNHQGAAVWQFPGNIYERFGMAAMQEVGIKVLIESDDNYTERIPYGDGWQLKMQEGTDQKPSVEMHRRIVKWVDGVIVTTDHLAKAYRKLTDKPVFVCPNQIDPQDWPELGSVKFPEWYDPDKVHVGAALSGSHARDLKLIGRACEWAAGQKNVQVVFLGVAPVDFRGRFPFVHIPWTTDLAAYRMLQGVLDIGLCPIVENAWALCRSDLKALEMLMSGAVPVLSDVGPYDTWTDGEGCRKAREPRDFMHAVQDLVKNPGRRDELAAEGRSYVLEERTVAGNIDKWREAVSV